MQKEQMYKENIKTEETNKQQENILKVEFTTHYVPVYTKCV